MTSQGVERKLTAILCADVKGYSRLMGEDEVATLETLTAYREVMDNFVELHHGRVVGSAGDSLLADFTSVVDAVQCAVEIQRELKKRNAELPEGRRMEFRIGVNLGDVIVKGDDIFGDGVNIAARLEGLAEPGGICISGGVYEQLKNKLALGYEFIGDREVKNIAEPVPAFRVRLEPGAAGPKQFKGARPRRWRSMALPAAAIAVVVGAAALAVWNFYLRTPAPPVDVASTTAPGTAPSQQLPDKPSIAVLPFVNMSGDPSQESFSDGITEDLITDLSNLENLIVISRSSVFSYKGKPIKVQQVGRELGVHYVLEGSVRKSADRVRITAQLVDATTGHHLWAERYDRDLKDVFAVQDEIAKKVVTAMAGFAVETLEGEQRFFEGVGVVTALEPGKSRLVVDHEGIKDFMAAMEMSYLVSPATLLRDLNPGDKIRFTIDADKRVIVDIKPLGE